MKWTELDYCMVVTVVKIDIDQHTVLEYCQFSLFFTHVFVLLKGSVYNQEFSCI